MWIRLPSNGTSLSTSKHNVNILHGEAYAIVAASLLSLNHNSSHIISDHLNSVHLLLSQPSPLRLINHPARSLYWWILDIWSRSSNHIPTISHICAHTSANNIESNLNHLVDHLASSSQHLPLPPPSAPLPSFFMDNHMLFSPTHGYIENSLPSFLDTLLATAQAATTTSYHESIPPLNLFDQTPPPAYPYVKTPSAYSAVIQLYSWSGQLDDEYTLVLRTWIWHFTYSYTYANIPGPLHHTRPPWSYSISQTFGGLQHHLDVFNTLMFSRSEYPAHMTTIPEYCITCPHIKHQRTSKYSTQATHVLQHFQRTFAGMHTHILSHFRSFRCTVPHLWIFFLSEACLLRIFDIIHTHHADCL